MLASLLIAEQLALSLTPITTAQLKLVALLVEPVEVVVTAPLALEL